MNESAARVMLSCLAVSISEELARLVLCALAEDSLSDSVSLARSARGDTSDDIAALAADRTRNRLAFRNVWRRNDLYSKQASSAMNKKRTCCLLRPRWFSSSIQVGSDRFALAIAWQLCARERRACRGPARPGRAGAQGGVLLLYTTCACAMCDVRCDVCDVRVRSWTVRFLLVCSRSPSIQFFGYCMPKLKPPAWPPPSPRPNWN